MSKGKGGRPEWKPTAEQKAKVEIAAGGGMSHEEIAIALGISAPTLKKHLGDELSRGAHLRRVEVLEALHQAATKKGNAAAAKAYLAGIPEAAAPDLDPEGAGEKLGKKAQANEDAKKAQVGTGWAEILPTAPGSRMQ